MSDLHAQYNEVEKLIDEEKFDDAIEGLKKIQEQDDNFVLAWHCRGSTPRPASTIRQSPMVREPAS